MRNMLKISLTILVLVALCAGAQAQPTAKNIIVMISDGWGQAQLDATAYWNGERASYEQDGEWTFLGMTNYMYHRGDETPPYGSDGFIGIHGYDSDQAWGDWYYMQNYATDSAAASTTMSCGAKTYKGSIGMDIDEMPMVHLMEIAEDMGMATGLVSSVEWSHATPAGYRAHNVTRNNYAEIAQELVGSGLDVIMGAGHPHYNDNGEWAEGDPEVPGDWKYVGGYEQWQALVNGETGYTLIDEKADFEALADGSLVLDRVCGTAQAAKTLQFNRGGDSAPYSGNYNTDLPPYHDAELANIPSLACMTMGALNVLGQNDNGFVMMVESGAVDWAGHARLAGRLIEEQNDFNAAYENVVAWVEANSNWDETLLVVTGDHETGYLWGAGVDPEDDTTWFAPIQDNGAGNMPGFYFYSAPGDDYQNPSGSAGHTNQAIPFFARGAGMSLITMFADEYDPACGYYLDNAELGVICHDLLTGGVPVENPGTETNELPIAAVALDQNYPNPFNPSTTIAFSLPRAEQVRLNIFDIQGRLVRTLADGSFNEGQHTVTWHGMTDQGQRAASGTYVYRLVTESSVLNKTMVLVK